MSSTTARTSYEDLISANLIIDSIYESKRQRPLNLSCEPLTRLIPGVGNMGGFRKRSGLDKHVTAGLVLMSTNNESDWPDGLDIYQGTYIYHGDNRKPGQSLHETPKKGNLELRNIFDLAHGDAQSRIKCPVILIFEGTGYDHDVIFRGLAVPGTRSLSPMEDLVAVWASKNGKRFQNYKATFSILDTGIIDGHWIREIFAKKPFNIDDLRVPASLRNWMMTGRYEPLMAPPTSLIRSVAEQQPQNLAEEKIISAILEYCKDDPYIFESAATDIWMKSCSLGMNVDVTRRWKDGGKDAIGNLILGPKSDPIKINFALEAKCYSPSNNVGVQEMSRLISRLKYREFGVLVTTSAVNAQAYKEIRADEHPIVVISGTDIAQVLISKRINSPKEVKIWMDGLSHQT
jgi:hypothetical protein